LKGKAKDAVHPGHKMDEKWNHMAKQDLQERLTEGAVGGALGLGLGAGAGSVYDRIKNKRRDQPGYPISSPSVPYPSDY